MTNSNSNSKSTNSTSSKPTSRRSSTLSASIPSADPLIVGRWNKKGKELREFSTMDVKMFIAKIYIMKYSSRDSLVYYEKDYERDIFRFAKNSNVFGYCHTNPLRIRLDMKYTQGKPYD